MKTLDLRNLESIRVKMRTKKRVEQERKPIHVSEHAARVKDAVSRLNKLAADATASGLSVRYLVHTFEQHGKPTSDCLVVSVSQEL